MTHKEQLKTQALWTHSLRLVIEKTRKMTLVWDRISTVQIIINISNSSNNNDGDDNDDDSGNNDDSVSIKDDCYSLSLQAIIMMTLSLLSLLSVGELCKCYGMHLFFRFVYCCVRSFIIFLHKKRNNSNKTVHIASNISNIFSVFMDR